MLTAHSRIAVPRRQPKTLRRIRLLDNLHNNIHRKVNFVCAPAGYGKTTLLVDFAEDVDAVILWYRITSEDQTLISFTKNLIHAFQQKFPKFGGEILEAIAAENISTGSLAYLLANEIENKVKKFSLLVLDDYHEISTNAEIVELVETFLQILPDSLRLLIGSRNVYGIPTALLYVQEQLNIIAEESLKFQPEEIIDLCRKYYKIQLTEEQSKQIASQAEGWIVAILLSLRTKNLALEIPKIVGAKEHIYTYLADDVISKLPPELMNFMHATSLVEEFNIPLANYILGIDNAEEIIKKLDDLNLFLTQTNSENRPTYRYHQLFSKFLREHFATHAKENVTQLHLNIANWYTQEEYFTKAITHYFKAGEKQTAAQMINQISQMLYNTGEMNILQSWYNRLSIDQDSLAETPILLLNLAKYKISQGNFDGIGEMLDIAQQSFQQQADHSNYANLLVTRGMHLRFSGQPDEARELAKEVQRYVEKHDLDPYYWHQAERLMGMTIYMSGDAGNALKHLNKAAKYFRQTLTQNFNTRQAHDLVMTLADIGYIALTTGNIFNAQKSYREALTLAHKVRGSGNDFATACNNFAYLNFLIGNYQEAWNYYLQAQEAAEFNNLTRHLGHILNSQADLLCDLEEWEHAQELYQKAQKIAENTGEDDVLIETLSGLVALETKLDNFNQAIFYLREKASIENTPTEKPSFLLSMTKIYLKMGQCDLAQNMIRQALEVLRPGSAPTQEAAEIHLFAALTQRACIQDNKLKEEATKKAAEHLQKCLEITALLGYDQFLVNSFRQHKKTLKQILAELPDSPQVQSIMTRANKKPPSLQELLTPDQLPEEEEIISLNVTAFDESTVRINGELIPASDWGSVRARALFYFILDRKQTTKDEIALEFWPEFSQAKVNSNFHATLWRVRNALSSKQILTFDNEHYQINPDVNLYFDLEEFESSLEELKKTKSSLGKRIAMRRMVEIYKNDYLEDIDMPWADQRRRELQNTFFNILTTLAEEEYQKQNYNAAAEHYLHAVQLDYFQEDLHLKVMQSLQAMGDTRRAIQHYKEYVSYMKREMDMEPGTALKKLAQSISE